MFIRFADGKRCMFGDLGVRRALDINSFRFFSSRKFPAYAKNEANNSAERDDYVKG